MSHSTTYVSSIVYNLAGDVNKRANFLKTTVVGAVFKQNDIAQTMTDAYLKGPGITLKSFARWARTRGYSDTVGLVTGSFFSTSTLNPETIKSQLPARAGYSIVVQDAEIGPADFIRWAEQYMGVNYPAEVDTPWSADYDAAANLVTITRTNSTQVVFTPVAFDKSANFLFVRYNYLQDPTISAVNYGATTYGSFPVFTNPVTLENNTVNTAITLSETTTTTTTWSDATPTTTTTGTTTSSAVQTNFDRIIAETVLVAPRSYEDRTYFLKQTGSVVSNTVTTVVTTNMGGGVTRTRTTDVTTQYISYLKETRLNYVTRTLSVVEALQTLIYARDSGNAALDAMFNGNGSMGTFFPYVPIRIENAFISPTYYPTIYTAAKKAVRKSTNSSFDKIVKKLSDNPQLGEIDFAYLIFGVALNTKENESKRYLYTFFERCAQQSNDSITYADWKAGNAAREAAIATYNAVTTTSDNGVTTGSVVYNPATQTWDYVPLPTIPDYVAPPSYSLNIASGNLPGMNFNINLSWTDMTLSTGTGLGRVGAKVGELWFEQPADETVSTQTLVQSEYGAGYETSYANYEKIVLAFQETSNRWRRITILNFVHRNFVYQGKVVTITAKQALNNAEESGFVVPMHEEIFGDTPMVSRTQMCNSAGYLMFNSYTIVAERHYSRGWFSFILIIVIIVIAIYYPPATAYLLEGGGILGANVAIGATLGFTGITAALVGLAANAIAGMILSTIITTTATAVFGEKIGAIIGFVASVYALQVGTMMASGQQVTMASMYNNMMKAENLMKLTMAVGDGVSQYMRASAKETMQETAKLMAEYKTKSEDITEKYEKEFGIGAGGVIDPMMLTDVSMPGYEPPATFLDRTLMTGSDIAEVSLRMISNFSSITLDLELQT